MFFASRIGSFVPSTAQRDLRDLTRHRSTLVAERARIINRLQKVLEDANIKLAAVASDIAGVSARAMLQGLLDGETDTQARAELAKGRMHSKRVELEQALSGRMRPHHAFLITEHLSHLEYLDESIERFTSEVKERLAEADEDIDLLDSMLGSSRRAAEVILAEIGRDMGRSPSAKHLASWAGICPGNHESAGKRKSGKTRKGSRWLRQMLIEAARLRASPVALPLRSPAERARTYTPAPPSVAASRAVPTPGPACHRRPCGAYYPLCIFSGMEEIRRFWCVGIPYIRDD